MNSPFLNVPLEIRNQIYRYLVIFNISPIPKRPKEGNYYARFQKPALDVSILRVNQQIHDEAAKVLYSENIFPIRLRITGDDFCKTGPTRNPYFAVTYQTFWEDLYYGQAIGQDPSVEYWSEVARGDYPFTRITKDEIVPIPSPRYQHLIRRAKIGLYDLRVIAFRQLGPSSGGRPLEPEKLVARDANWRKLVMAILMPFVRGRLDGIISNPENAYLDIEIQAAFIHPTSHAQALSKELTEAEVDALDVKYLKELAYTAWPLTTFAGRSRLIMDHPAARIFEGIKKEALAECDNGEVVFSKEEEEGFKEKNLSEMHSWAIEEGKLVVTDPFDSYPQKKMIRCFPTPRSREDREDSP
ncbi:hypothetical protein TWF718_002016 [Orbilia javanica]|uniref:Uncharacterized protein n=1 Tax=Orbilia javanica TaxID=47235 RepID=A0AAN8N9F1_9PEZI